MKLNAQEIQNYLARFYDALEAISGTPIGNNGYYMHFPDTARSPAILHRSGDTRPVFVAPAWDELKNVKEMTYDTSHQFGITSIVMQHDDDYCQPVRIPFHMAFDMKKDVAHFIERLSSISAVQFKKPVDGELIVYVDGGEYSSDQQNK